MSKGWESKSVEEQQAEAARPKSDAKPAGNLHADADRKRRIQALEMQREHVLSQRTSSPHRRSALEAALAAIEYELEQLALAIKL